MEEMIVEVTPEGMLRLPEPIMEAFAGVKAFVVSQRDGHIVLTPAEPPLDVETRTATEALARLREMVAEAGGMNKTVDEIVEDLRAIRKEIWERELRPKYAEALERYYAEHPDRRPRQRRTLLRCWTLVPS